MYKKHIIVIVALALLGASGFLLAQPSLPLEKQAIEEQYAQERAAGAQNPAPKDPDAPYPVVPEIPFRTGIISDLCSAPFPALEASIGSCWQGIVDGERTIVYAGAEGYDFDPRQGIVYVITIPDYPVETSGQRLRTQIREGAVTIVAAENNVLMLVSDTGSYVLTFDVATREFTSVVVDVAPPVISGMPTKCTLWPPNHKMVKVATVTASDALSGVAQGTFTLSATSSEPSKGSRPDIVITPNEVGGFTVNLRSERLGKGTERVYELTAEATDNVGNTVTSTATCVVPHDQRP